MKTVAVKEFRNRLSSYLRDVRQGELVLVTDRGRVIAEMRRPSNGTLLAGHEQAFERLSAEGVLVPGLPQDPRAYRRSPLRLSVASGDLLEAERGSQ